MSKASFLSSNENGKFQTQDTKHPAPGAGEVLVKNHALAVNPLDWKVQAFGKYMPFPSHYPAILGEDVAGEIAEVGTGVTNVKTGDRVIGMANWLGSAKSTHGGFQEYTIVYANTLSLLPSNVSFQSGVVMPLAICTSAMALYPAARLGLPLPTTSTKDSGKTIFVWGGSSSTGATTIQLATASGVKVVAVASPKNHEIVKELGATTVLDYNDKDVVAKAAEAVKAAGGTFAGAVDAITDEATTRAAADVVKALGGGKVVTFGVMPVEGLPDGVELFPLYDTAAIKDNKEIVDGVWGQYVPEALKSGALKTFPEPHSVGKGIDKVAEAVATLQKGVSAKKIIIEL